MNPLQPGQWHPGERGSVTRMWQGGKRSDCQGMLDRSVYSWQSGGAGVGG